MQVILLQDVAKIGKRFEEVKVPDGYALNLLIPKGMAETATPENRKKIAARASKQTADAAAGVATVSAAAAAFSDAPLEITVEANEQGHLFEALKSEVVAGALATAGHSISAEQVTMPEPIKSLGEHQVALVSGGEEATLTLNVVQS